MNWRIRKWFSRAIAYQDYNGTFSTITNDPAASITELAWMFASLVCWLLPPCVLISFHLDTLEWNWLAKMLSALYDNITFAFATLPYDFVGSWYGNHCWEWMLPSTYHWDSTLCVCACKTTEAWTRRIIHGHTCMSLQSQLCANTLRGRYWIRR